MELDTFESQLNEWWEQDMMQELGQNRIEAD